MPRAILAQSAHADRSRTMSSVSDELGVSPSTLRTWERRYGLGPAQRETGERRRYQPEDVDRLRAMIHHVHAGSPPPRPPSVPSPTSTLLPRRGPATPPSCAPSSSPTTIPRLEEVLEAAVASHGLVHTWSRFVEPTLKSLRSTPGGDPVGCPARPHAASTPSSACAAPSTSLAPRPLPRRRGPRRPHHRRTPRDRPPRSSASPWPGTAATCACCPAKTTGACAPANRFREYVRGGVPALTVVLGCGPACADTVEASSPATAAPRSSSAPTPPTSWPPTCSACARSAPASKKPSRSWHPRRTSSSSAVPDALTRPRVSI